MSIVGVMVIKHAMLPCELHMVSFLVLGLGYGLGGFSVMVRVIFMVRGSVSVRVGVIT